MFCESIFSGRSLPKAITWSLRCSLLGALLFSLGAARGADCEKATRSEAVADGVISYQVAGAGPDVVLLHGLFAQKEQWDELLCDLASAGYRASALDLPGYAQSRGHRVEVYALENQVELIAQLMRQRRIERFHLAGNSMGGAIAAIYARQHPQQVASLAFIGGPLGIGEWAEPVRKVIVGGVNPFIPVDQQQLDLEFQLLMVKVPQLSVDVKQAIIAPYVDQPGHFRQVWDIVNLYGNALRSLPPNRLSTLIVWGSKDQVFDVAGVQPLAESFPNSRRVVLDEAGHLPMIDAPAATAAAYVDFLRALPAF